MKKKILYLLSAVLLAAGMLTTTAYGAEAAVTLKSVESIAAEESFSVGADFYSPSVLLRSATLEVSYDDEILQFRNCSGGEGFAEDGVVRISLYDVEGTGNFVCKIRFRALSPGDSFITVTTADLKDINGEDVTAETRAVKVTVTEKVNSSEDAEQKEAGPENRDDSASGSEEENRKEAVSLELFFHGLSDLEFLGFCICLTVIILLLVLLAAERRKRH